MIEQPGAQGSAPDHARLDRLENRQNEDRAQLTKAMQSIRDEVHGLAQLLRDRIENQADKQSDELEKSSSRTEYRQERNLKSLVGLTGVFLAIMVSLGTIYSEKSDNALRDSLKAIIASINSEEQRGDKDIDRILRTLEIQDEKLDRIGQRSYYFTGYNDGHRTGVERRVFMLEDPPQPRKPE